MLFSLGLERGDVFITNTVKCRPPNNRDPEGAELAACGAYLDQQLRLLNPKMILCVGRISAQSLLQTDASVGRLRGRVHEYVIKDSEAGERTVPLIVTYHPAYLLRQPDKKPLVYGDLRLLGSLRDI